MKRVGFYFARPHKGQLVLNVWLLTYVEFLVFVEIRLKQDVYVSVLALRYENWQNLTKSNALQRVKIKKRRLLKNQICGMLVWWRENLQCLSTQTEGIKYKHHLKHDFQAKFRRPPQTKPLKLYWTQRNKQLIWIAKYDEQSKILFHDVTKRPTGIQPAKQEGNGEISHKM